MFHIKNKPGLIGLDNGNGTATVSGKCVITGKHHTVVASLEGLMNWMEGEHIQDALSELDKDEREFLISRTSPEGWESTFGGF